MVQGLTENSLACVILFRSLGTVLRTTLTAVSNARGIQRSADCVVSHTRQIFHPATANKYNGVLLQVVPFPADI